MILGVGTDVVEIARVAAALDRWGERFVERILTPEERLRYAHTRQKASHLAKRFAAKEAFSKAIGTGFRAPVLLSRISVVQDALGKPGFAFHASLAALLAARGVTAHHLSLTDEAGLAFAVVVLERGG